MAKDLDSLRPKWSPRKKLVAAVSFPIVLAVLVTSYIYTDMDPIRLWEKRQNAFEYLFGKEIDEETRQSLRRQAERAPEMLAREQARSEINRKYEGVEDAPDFTARQAEISARGQEILEEQTAEERQEIVEGHYAQLLEDRRGGYFPPESRPDKLKAYGLALLETVAIAIWGSLLAFLTAVPFAFLAAENTLAIIAPGDAWHHRVLRWLGYFICRRFLDACRGFNEFVMALIFVAVIGLGPFAGVLALWIHTFGILGKVVSEAIEASDNGQIEGVTATGARPVQVLAYAVLPQTMPIIVSYSLLRFEANVRSATILGFCGAGGIGFLMFDKLNGYLYQEVATMMLMVIITVGVIDFFTSKLRQAVT